MLTDLSVAENLSVAGYHLQRAKRDAGIEAALETFPELRAKLTSRAGSLSKAVNSAMLVLAQALVDRPRLLLADELSFGLAPVVVARVVPVVSQLADLGIGASALIEQYTAYRASTRASCLRHRNAAASAFPGSPTRCGKTPDILHSAYLAA